MIRLIKPAIAYPEVENEFKEIFESGIFTKGKYVEEFRKALCSYTVAQYSFLTTSATTALWTGLKVLNIGAGDEVLISDFSFPATANVVEDVGARPVFADVDPLTFNLLPGELERKISAKTKAVIFVDALGNPSGLQAIREICRGRKIPLIEDAACAMGSAEGARKCGAVADLTCFSFHPRKLLTTGEGGAITTDHSEYAETLARKLNHGAVAADGKADFIDYGYNFRLPELQAVMGIKQLEKLDALVVERNRIREQYRRLLEPLGFVPQKINTNVVYNVQSLVFLVPKGVSRDSLIRDLKSREIESTIGTYCLSATAYYKKKYNSVQPNALMLQENTITLPCYQGVAVDTVCGAIRDFVKR